MEEPVEDTQAVLAAYRERKRKALAAREAGGEPAPAEVSVAPGPEPPTSPSFTFAPASGPTTARPAETDPVDEVPGLGSDQAAHGIAFQPHREEEPSAQDAAVPATGLELRRSAAPATAAGATLSALGPTVRLSDALLKDRTVSLRGSPRARVVGVSLLLTGLIAAALERRQAALGAPVEALDLLAVTLVLAGGVTALLGLALPRRRRLAVRLAASQQEEWTRIQLETGRLRRLVRLGLALAVVGLLALIIGYAVGSTGLAVAGLGLAGIGLPLLVVAHVRRGLARRLYVQTLVLSVLEASGLGGAAPDERVQPVILALDRLLGALPESEVQAFLATPQAKAYLELVDEATRSQRGP